ncbi:hypothetical protein Y1Q_0020425 [Alligator mississippiensis]|uniref:Uncharacterized protein n=1 Tax=Alligator mississippiensis TaxID=8496 RepID=A0A151N7J9_ALLMI|nr:hypothetical protein Y1Q_0020425 [Alligator mississippiensis]
MDKMDISFLCGKCRLLKIAPRIHGAADLAKQAWEDAPTPRVSEATIQQDHFVEPMLPRARTPRPGQRCYTWD